MQRASHVGAAEFIKVTRAFSFISLGQVISIRRSDRASGQLVDSVVLMRAKETRRICRSN